MVSISIGNPLNCFISTPVSKLQKEKKAWADGRQQKEEELQAAEDKANHLTKIKMKLEQNLDELEDSVEREKKVQLRWISDRNRNANKQATVSEHKS